MGVQLTGFLNGMKTYYTSGLNLYPAGVQLTGFLNGMKTVLPIEAVPSTNWVQLTGFLNGMKTSNRSINIVVINLGTTDRIFERDEN